MLIYLEGVDGSGKSTLAAAIVKRLIELKNIRKIECVPNAEKLIPTNPNKPDRLDTNELFKQLLTMCNDPETVYVCDRGPISDIIYRVFDDHKPLTNLLPLAMFLKSSLMTVVVYCDTEKSYDLMMGRGETNTVSIQHHKSIKYLYNEIMPMFDPVRFDLAEDNTNEVINLIMARLFIARDYYLKRYQLDKGGQHNE